MAAGQVLVDVVEDILANNDALTVSTYTSFWLRLGTDGTFCSCYIVTLIAKLLVFDTGLENEKGKKFSLSDAVTMIMGSTDFAAVKKGGELEENQRRQREAIVNTLNFIGTHYAYDTGLPMLRAALTKWQNFRGNARGEFADEVLRQYVNRSFDNLSLTLVDLCSNVDCHSGLASPPPPIPNYLSAAEMAPSHSNTFLQSLVMAEFQTGEIFRNILLFLKHPGIREGRLLSLLHMLELFLSMDSTSVTNDDLLRTVDVVKQYYLWPLPYGTTARRSLNLLVEEMRAPGEAFRRRVLEDNSSMSGSLVRAMECHVCVNPLSGHGARLLGMLRMAPQVLVTTRQLKFDVIHNAFRQVLGELYSQETCDALASVGDGPMTEYFNSVLEAMASSLATVDPTLGIDGVKAVLLDIKAKALACTDTTPEGCEVQAVPPTPSMDMHILAMTANLLESQAAVAPLNMFNLSSIATLENILKTYNEAKSSSASSSAAGAGAGAAATTPATPSTPSGATGEEEARKRTVRVAVVGGDGTLNSIVGGYVALRLAKGALFTGLELQFYVVPTGHRNHFAKFLAGYDGWYSRHVLGLAQTLMRVIPCVVGVPAGGPTNMSMTDFDATRLTISTDIGTLHPTVSGERPSYMPRNPCEILRTELESYLMRARCRLDVKIFICELSFLPTANCGDRTVPFIQRVEIGHGAALRAHVIAKEIDPTLPDELIPQKKFSFSGVDVSMSFSEVSIGGLVRPGPVLEPRSYWSVSIANCPRAGDRGSLPHPTSGWLEMYALDADAGKKLQKGKSGLIEGEHTYHVGGVELETPKGKKREGLLVLIDGELHAEVASIKISPLLDPITNAQMTFPVMTYFPLDM